MHKKKLFTQIYKKGVRKKRLFTYLRSVWLAFFVLSLLCYLLLFPRAAAESARNGLLLWYHSVLPVIFPFLFLSSVMIRILSAEDLPQLLTRPFMYAFGCSAYGAFAILAGFLCGMPVGAKLTSELYRNDKISRKEALFLTGFNNNLSPGFLLSYLAVGQMNLAGGAWLVPMQVLGAAFLFGLLEARTNMKKSRFSSGCAKHPAGRKNSEGDENSGMKKHTAELIDDCVFDAMESALRLGAYILLFEILSEALMRFFPINNPCILLFVSTIEVTNGVRLLARSSLSFAGKYIGLSALAAFGGFSALVQSAGIAHMDREFLLHYIKSRVKITLLAILLSAAAFLLQTKIL